MDVFYLIVFFLFGLVFGSFYNVVGLRLGKGESIAFPSSHCPKCGHSLKFYENIPVISYIFLRGKCKKCKEKISIMYPVIEFFTGILFSLCYYSFGLSIELVLILLISSLFIIIIVTDLNYYIIPDSIIIVFGILIFSHNIVSKGFLDACTFVVYGLIMFIFMFALMKLGNFLFKEESLGGGDIKLMGILGMTLSPLLSFASLTLAALIALPGSLFFYLKRKDKIIPFGPFIVGGFLIIIFSKITTPELLELITFV